VGDGRLGVILALKFTFLTVLKYRHSIDILFNWMVVVIYD
jgi:hypothetical protein